MRPLPQPFSAVLLAAGRSTRMGCDKALLEVERDGERIPLWRHQRDTFARAGAAEIFLSARPEQEWANGLFKADVAPAATALASVRLAPGAARTEMATSVGFDAVLHDALSVGGPMVGIAAALERASHPHVAVLAIDLPRMEPAWFASLLAECAPGIGCVGRSEGVGKGNRGSGGPAGGGGEKFFEPLAAIYPRELKWLAWEALVRGEFSLQTLLAAAVVQGLMRVREIGPAEAAWFDNWNAPAQSGRAGKRPNI